MIEVIVKIRKEFGRGGQVRVDVNEEFLFKKKSVGDSVNVNIDFFFFYLFWGGGWSSRGVRVDVNEEVKFL